jgi:hypothetical protein
MFIGSLACVHAIEVLSTPGDKSHVRRTSAVLFVSARSDVDQTKEIP